MVRPKISKEMTDLLHTAVDRGITFFDAAEGTARS